VPLAKVVAVKEKMNSQTMIVYLLCVFLLSVKAAMQMDVYPGEMRCVGQELDEEDVALFALSATSTHAVKAQEVKQVLTASLTDPEGGSILSNEKVVIGARPRELRESIDLRGVYKLCFELQGGKTPVRVFFHVDFKSKNAPGSLEAVGKVGKEDLPTLESQLKAAEMSLSDISREIEFAKREEVLLKEAGDTTVSRIQWFGILSIAILLATTLWQLIYLRSFFASKKLL